MEKDPGKGSRKKDRERWSQRRFRKKGCVRHVHQDHESAYGNGRRSALPDRYVFKLAEAWKNGKGYGKAHHSGTENESYPVNTGNTRV